MHATRDDALSLLDSLYCYVNEAHEELAQATDARRQQEIRREIFRYEQGIQREQEIIRKSRRRYIRPSF